MLPIFTLDKIKFATDSGTFERAVKIYESGGVVDFKNEGGIFSARVQGSKNNFYEVTILAKAYSHGNCNCYLGERDVLCKHMVAVALYALFQGRKMTMEETEIISSPRCSGELGKLSKEELSVIKKEITKTMQYIKPYNGPSRIWGTYQNSLSEGCARLSKLVTELPVSEQTAKLLVNILVRLDRKLCRGGVDDSGGIVGGFIEETVEVLREYIKLDARCVKVLKKLENQEICFGWEEVLFKKNKKR